MAGAREADQKKKMENANKVNGSKYRKKSHFPIGDNILVRNYNKSRKFDTLFLQKPFKIIDMNRKGNIVTVQQERSCLTLYRHPDDLKPMKSRLDNPEEGHACIQNRPDNPKKGHACIQNPDIQWPEKNDHDDDGNSYDLRMRDTAQPLRRSQRKRTTIPTYKH